MINPPKTLADARKETYGPPHRSAAYRPDQCAYAVWPNGAWGSEQCCRQPGHGPDALYCKQHAKKVTP
jgi:hypothetical protein